MTSPSPKPVDDPLKRFVGDDQDPDTVRRVHQQVSQVLTAGEEIVYIAVQARPVVNISPDCVILTSKRFILYKPSLLGRVEFEDYIWRELHDARLEENLIGATLTLQTVDGRQLMMDYLPKAQARRLYAFAQEMEEKTLEERRQRELEERRAAAGGITLSGGGPGASAASAPADEGPVHKLKQLKDMLDGGLITQAEYDAKKAEILSRM